MTTEENELFIFDSAPDKNDLCIPSYKRRIDEVVPRQVKVKKSSDEVCDLLLKGGICFNCEGNHTLRECTKPRNNENIMRNRKKMQALIRYHLEDDQRFGHFQAGSISNSLRGALGLGPKQIPMHVYKMRIYGYPPGWLEEHKIKHSGLSLIDSEVNNSQEEHEFMVLDEKHNYDIKKLIAYPGFNIKPESGTLDESNFYGVPPFNPEQDKSFMIKRIAEDANRSCIKQNTVLPTEVPNGNNTHDDMDIATDEMSPTKNEFSHSINSSTPKPQTMDNTKFSRFENQSCQKLMSDKVSEDSRSSSPSLTELENTKRLLLQELNSFQTTSENKTNSVQNKQSFNNELENPQESGMTNLNTNVEEKIITEDRTIGEIGNESNDQTFEQNSADDSDMFLNVTPMESVRRTSLNTPVINYTKYAKIPNPDSFSKEIADIINFENLPDALGKYDNMRGVLKKVRSAMQNMN